jgi:hypothetical protein
MRPVVKANNKPSTLRAGPSPESHARPEPPIVIVVPTAPDLVLGAEAPKFFRTVDERNRWRREKMHQIWQELGLSESMLPPGMQHNIVCKKFKDDPFAKQHKINPSSKSTFLRAIGKKR